MSPVIFSDPLFGRFVCHNKGRASHSEQHLQRQYKVNFDHEALSLRVLSQWSNEIQWGILSLLLFFFLLLLNLFGQLGVVSHRVWLILVHLHLCSLTVHGCSWLLPLSHHHLLLLKHCHLLVLGLLFGGHLLLLLIGHHHLLLIGVHHLLLLLHAHWLLTIIPHLRLTIAHCHLRLLLHGLVWHLNALHVHIGWRELLCRVAHHHLLLVAHLSHLLLFRILTVCHIILVGTQLFYLLY